MDDRQHNTRTAPGRGSAGCVAGATLQQLFEYHGVIVLRVPGRVHQCEGFPARERLKCMPCRIVLQFRAIALLERRPFPRIVSEPCTQLSRGGDFLQPEVDPGIDLGQTARPQPIHQHPIAIAFGRRVISTLQLHDIHRRPPCRGKPLNSAAPKASAHNRRWTGIRHEMAPPCRQAGVPATRPRHSSRARTFCPTQARAQTEAVSPSPKQRTAT